MNKCKFETSNGRCGLKDCYAYRHKCFTKEFCKCHQPMTVADYIRNMTDEEMADYQCRIIATALKGMGVNMFYDHEAAVKIRLKQLQQPAGGIDYG